MAQGWWHSAGGTGLVAQGWWHRAGVAQGWSIAQPAGPRLQRPPRVRVRVRVKVRVRVRVRGGFEDG